MYTDSFRLIYYDKSSIIFISTHLWPCLRKIKVPLERGAIKVTEWERKRRK